MWLLNRVIAISVNSYRQSEIDNKFYSFYLGTIPFWSAQKIYFFEKWPSRGILCEESKFRIHEPWKPLVQYIYAILVTISLEAVRSSSVNSVRRIWNELPAEVATTHELRQFKRLIRSPEVYAALSIRNVIRKVESNLWYLDRIGLPCYILFIELYFCIIST